jgi:hypothetical protein
MAWDEREARSVESERGPRSSPRRKVMVIDDSEIVLEATKAMLQQGASRS